MRTKNSLFPAMRAIGIALVVGLAPMSLGAQQKTDPAIRIGNNDIGGVVKSATGPEAGVWVIAETTGLPTHFAKIVVTDDQGRYVIPDLPKANYDVWVRGYGLINSPRVVTNPGKNVDLTAVPAPNAAAGSQYYPAIYWYSMLNIPDQSQFSGPKRDEEDAGRYNRPGAMAEYDKDHRLHRLPRDRHSWDADDPAALGHFASSADAWARRIQSGQAETTMVNTISRLDPQLAFQYFGDWTDKIAKGELPFAKPSRPQGIERNVVLTLWDWSRPTAYLHDLTPTDRRNPTINANGKLYGTAEESTDNLPVLDPAHNSVSEIKHPVRDPNTPTTKTAPMEAVALLGCGTDLGQRERHAQPDDGRERPGLVHRQDPLRSQPGFLQAGIEPSLGAGVSAADNPAASCRCMIRRRESSRSSTPASRRTI